MDYSVKLASPIERIRGGEIVFAVEVTKDNVTKLGFSSFSGDDQSSLLQAYNDAVQVALNQFNSESKTASLLAAVILDNKLDSTASSYQEKFNAGTLSKEHYDLLNGPINEDRISELNSLLDLMGIDRINFEKYTLLQGLTLINYLKGLAKKLEQS
jgi:hypothetical protein